ncbi:hypothetical protein ACODYM_28855 [Burkholderia gladioli]|uniref:hypothetical protein n=1 Tax=Burkholderia gladioli TaxID=28095 RepID=UPI003B50CCFB
MIFRLIFVCALLLALFYGLIRLIESTPFLKQRQVARRFVKNLLFVSIAAAMTSGVVAFLSTVDHIL